MDTTTHHEQNTTGAFTRSSRSPVEAADLDRRNRPGVPKERPPQPWPNSRFPPQRMQAEPSVPKHDRPNKLMPPVYGTAVPLRGVSGALRRMAYGYPDHVATHWLMLMLADRVDSWGTRTWRLLEVATPLALVIVGARALGRRRWRAT